MSETVNRIAEFIRDKSNEIGDPLTHEFCMAIAGYSLVTLLNPTEAMNDAGYQAACAHDNSDTAPSLEIAPATFKAMIEEALK